MKLILLNTERERDEVTVSGDFRFRVLQFKQRVLSKTFFFFRESNAVQTWLNIWTHIVFSFSKWTLLKPFSLSEGRKTLHSQRCNQRNLKEKGRFFVLKCWNFKRTYTSSLKILHRQSMSSSMLSSMKPWEKEEIVFQTRILSEIKTLCWALLVLHRYVNNRYSPQRVCIIEAERATTHANSLVGNPAAVASVANAQGSRIISRWDPGFILSDMNRYS